jgi:hypothetical protein
VEAGVCRGEHETPGLDEWQEHRPAPARRLLRDESSQLVANAARESNRRNSITRGIEERLNASGSKR